MTWDRAAQLALAAVLGAAVWQAFEAPSAGAPRAARITCADYRTQGEAQEAYARVRAALDGDGDGRACERLP